jgi:cysteinyl-tRNA synthetase
MLSAPRMMSKVPFIPRAGSPRSSLFSVAALSSTPLSKSFDTVRIGKNHFRLSESEGNEVSWYACGPTVYDVAHLGHARTYVTTDIVRRVLQDYFQMPIKFAMGITDIDDKIINRCKSMNLSSVQEVKQFTVKMEEEFFADMRSLDVLPPDAILRVTEHIPEIISFVQTLVNSGYAYIAKDGAYFSFSKLPTDHDYDRFGNLGGSLLNPSEADDAASSVAVTHDKRDSKDFALWKLNDSTESVGWDSPWGKGRPGWHIECSTMTYEYFGTRLDIHSGGIDLQFPHHTNEIAQSECHHRSISHENNPDCCFNPTHPWVQHWIHTGHIHIAGRKMSKSLKNFISVQDYLQKNLTSFPSDDFRIFCLQNKYDSQVTYSEDRIRDAAAVREKISEFLVLVDRVQKQNLQVVDTTTKLLEKPAPEAKLLTSKLLEAKLSIRQNLSNDFHTPAVIEVLLDLISSGNGYGSKLLQQYSSVSAVKSRVYPLEPLLSIQRYVRNLLIMLGLKFCQNECASQVPQLISQQKALDILVELRSTVRNLVVAEMKASKGRIKSSSVASSDSTEIEQHLKRLCQNLLKATDKTRVDAERELEVKLDDGYGSDTLIRKK